MSLCHKHWFSNLYIFGTKCCRPSIFQTMNSVRSNILSLKYQRFTTSGSKDIGVWIFGFLAKSQLLSMQFCTIPRKMRTVAQNPCNGVSESLPYPMNVRQGKSFQLCTNFLYCSVLSLGSKVNTRVGVSQPDMGSIFQIKNQWYILVIGIYNINYQN